ncbi:transporter substrate-binding domain-containing protein [Roseitranquillus sediminis]|uniref:transporter substrate-binding domain-containing protein n=1 Tax=Roseitranquillus sediminis TaxID=2809051 RepID=UPI001D0CBCEB|nr:transporter substrate-binding domain-containing protein [Roseitranquillus sediminis]MBM9593197.1 transporter substrate-binding domain-containing protein [Roseitranquillus sediminis]
MSEQLRAIAPGEALRAAINLGNRALAREEDGELRGITPALAKRLADEIGKPVEFVVYGGAGKTFDDAGEDRWDVGFLAIDPERAKTVAFTRPYKEIVATYAVRDDSPVRSVEDADKPDTRILVALNSAYDLYLTKALQHADLIRASDPGESFEMFRRGEGDLVGGVLQSLQRAFPEGSGVRILPGRITAVRQAMVLPYHDADRIAALDAFVERAIADGFVEANS